MLKKIMDVITIICFVIMVFAIILYYQTPTGRALVCVTVFISIITCGISDYLEDKEEQES